MPNIVQRNVHKMHLISGNLNTIDMKDVIVRVSSWLLCLIGYSGTVACSAGMVADEYGTPYASYEVKGKVTDENDQPITGISVECGAFYTEPVYTGEDGSYEMSGTGFPRQKIEVAFVDVDGEENGGTFASRIVSEEAVHVQDGQGSWDYGKFSVEVDVKLSLEPKTDAEEM